MQRRTAAAAARPLLLYMLLTARGPRAAHAQGAPGSQPRSTVLLVDDDDVVYRPQTERVLFPMQRSTGQVLIRFSDAAIIRLF